MADTTIKTVIVELIGKTDKLQKDFKKVERKTNALTAGFKKMGLALVGAFGARALFRGFQQTLRSTDQLIKTAKGVGFAVSEYEELIFALEQVGINAGSAKIAIGDFQKRLAKGASGVSPQFAKAFKQAGLDPQSLSKLSPAEAFDVALTRLAAIRNDPAIAGLTGNVFEEQSGKDILAALRQYEKFQSARVTFQRRIGSLTKEETRNIEALNEELKIYRAQWEAIKMRVVAQTAPALLDSLNAVLDSGVIEDMTAQLGTLLQNTLVDLQKIKELKTAFDIMRDENAARFGAPKDETFVDYAKRKLGTNLFKGSQGDLSMWGHTDMSSIPTPGFPGGMTGQRGAGGGATQFNQTVNIAVKRGSGGGEITTAEAARIRKEFERAGGFRAAK